MHACMHAIIELFNNDNELSQTTVLETIFHRGQEDFIHTLVSGKQINIIIMTFLSELLRNDHHFYGTALLPKST